MLPTLLITLITVTLPTMPAQAEPSVTIPRKAKTVTTGNDVDDCAIWLHPDDPARSLVIINDKGPKTASSGLFIYDLQGNFLQKIPLYRPQNPDIRYDVHLGNDIMDVLVFADREASDKRYNRIRIFRINPDKNGDENGFLTERTTDGGISSGQNEAYGHSLYRRPSDGALYSIVSSYGRDDFTQILLESDGVGKIKGTLVRSWGSSDIKGDLCEGICCDDERGYIYICDENTGVLQYHADPDRGDNSLCGFFARDDGIKSDREGINIYRCEDSTGYIVISSQGNNQIKLYDRITLEFMGTVIPKGMHDCDGLDVSAASLGSEFPHGMAAFHLGSFRGASFGFYDWSDIASGLNLSTPCDVRRSTNEEKNAIKHSRTSPYDNSGYSRDFTDVVIFDLRGRRRGIFNGSVSTPLSFPEEKTMKPGVYLVKDSRGGNGNIRTIIQSIRQ